MSRLPGRLAAMVQASRLYRRAARRLVTITVREATESDRIEFARRRGIPPPPPLGDERTEFVALAGRRLVAHSVLIRNSADHHAWPGFWEFDTFVLVRWRGTGAGRAVFAALLDRAGRDGAKEVFAVVHPDNGRSLGLHGEFGAEMVGFEWPRIMPNGRRRLVLRLVIQA